MPDHKNRSFAGKITHVFGHRFVVAQAGESLLADLTPHGLAQVSLKVGDSVDLFGEQKPSELKVSRLTRDGKTIEIAHKDKHDKHHDADPRIALQAARSAGFEALGEPRRKPKHFEVLGRRGSELIELHIELDGHIRKSKAADRHDPKWSQALHSS